MSYRCELGPIRSAPLAGEFGSKLAERFFDQPQIAEILATHPKAWIVWRRVERGGWYRTGPGYGDGSRSAGFVLRPGVIDVHVEVHHKVIAESERCKQLLEKEWATAADLERWKPLPDALSVIVEAGR